MLLNPRRYGDGAKDLFITLNCVQENIIRGGQGDRSRRRPDGSRMPKSRAIKGIDEDMKLNKALWETAEVLRTGEAQQKIDPTGGRSNPPRNFGAKIANAIFPLSA